MAQGDTAGASQAFEAARAGLGDSFGRYLELGVLYLAARRPEDARTALDQVSPQHPAYAMALFKRAQVSVLLAEPDAAQRIAMARQRADATTGPLIAGERLFQPFPPCAWLWRGHRRLEPGLRPADFEPAPESLSRPAGCRLSAGGTGLRCRKTQGREEKPADPGRAGR